LSDIIPGPKLNSDSVINIICAMSRIMSFEDCRKNVKCKACFQFELLLKGTSRDRSLRLAGHSRSDLRQEFGSEFDLIFLVCQNDEKRPI
jgi:hypothetical protein